MKCHIIARSANRYRMDKLSQRLQHHHLTKSDISEIQSIARPRNTKTHKVLVNYGEKCQKIYFVERGAFILKFLNEESGNERAISFHLENFQPFMSVPHSYFNNVPANCKLQAIKNSDVFEFDKRELLDLVKHNARIKEFYYQEIIYLLLAEFDFRIKLLSYSPRKLYEMLIDNYQEIIKNVPSKDIASFIGISPEWLSNLKQKI